MIVPLIFLAGGIGSLLRFIIDGLIRSVLGRRFPWGTLAINIAGSFLLGYITALATHYNNSDLRLVMGVGFCGGFTTFSTAIFEAVRLLQSKRYVTGLLQVLANTSLAVLVATIGLGLVK